jgi:hypothetical protein
MSELILPPGHRDGDELPVLDIMGFALQHYADRLSVFPVDGLLMDAARKNDKRPAYLKVATVDSIVRNLTGNEKLRDVVLILRIPREVVDRAQSPVRLANEA